MKYEDAIVQIGLAKEETLKRFSGNEGLLKKFLLKFPQDTSAKQIKDALEKEDYSSVQKAAHTLKGLAGNLGLTTLFQKAALLSDRLKQNDTVYAREHGSEVVSLCCHICDVLSKIED